MVGVPGLEPGTSTSRTWRATKLRYTPMRKTTQARAHSLASSPWTTPPAPRLDSLGPRIVSDFGPRSFRSFTRFTGLPGRIPGPASQRSSRLATAPL